MTPRQLDPDVVHARLASMRELLDDLDTIADVTTARLQADRMLRHALERILTQLVELASSINAHVSSASLGRSPTDYRDSFATMVEVGALRADLAAGLAPSAGLRNVLTHQYVDIDLAIVAGAASAARSQFREYTGQIAAFVTD